MADLKITQLPVVTVVGDSDPLAVVVAGVTSQITKENLLTGFGGGPSAAEVAALIAASGHLNAAEVAALIAAAGHQSAAQVTALIAASGHQSAAQVAALIAAAGGTGTTAPAVPAIVVGDLPSPADATGTQFYGVEEGNSGHAESINFAKGVADRAVLNIVADRLSDAFGYQAIYGFNRTAISGVDIGGGVFPLPVVILRAYIAPASGAPANWKLVVDTASSALAFAHIDVTVVPTRSAVQAAVRCFRVVGSADNAARYETGPHNLTRPFVVGERFQIKIKGFGQTNFANIAPPDYFLTLSTEEDLSAARRTNRRARGSNQGPLRDSRRAGYRHCFRSRRAAWCRRVVWNKLARQRPQDGRRDAARGRRISACREHGFNQASHENPNRI